FSSHHFVSPRFFSHRCALPPLFEPSLRSGLEKLSPSLLRGTVRACLSAAMHAPNGGSARGERSDARPERGERTGGAQRCTPRTGEVERSTYSRNAAAIASSTASGCSNTSRFSKRTT